MFDDCFLSRPILSFYMRGSAARREGWPVNGSVERGEGSDDHTIAVENSLHRQVFWFHKASVYPGR